MDPRQPLSLALPSTSAPSPAGLPLPAVLGARPAARRVVRERLRAGTATVAAR